MVLVDRCFNSFNVLNHDEKVGDEDEKQAKEGEEAQKVEEIELGLGGDGPPVKHCRKREREGEKNCLSRFVVVESG
jgi:hypothetical protein